MERKDDTERESRWRDSTASTVTRVLLDTDLEHWMTRLPVSLKAIPIIHLAIPGSHDTMTYTIERRDNVGPDEPNWMRALGKYCPFVSKPIIFNWSVTQCDGIKRQLDGGIRYLDLRVATKPSDDEIYFLHGLYGSEITQPLKEVANWLSSHPKEILIVDFQHFYSFTEEVHRRLMATINRIFSKKLCPVASTFSHITLDWLGQKGYQVFVIYRSVFAKDHAELWPSGLWKTPWPNTVRPDELIEFLNAELRSRQFNIGFVSQCLLTPDTSYVLKHLCGTLQRDLAPQCEKAILPWIEEKQPGQGGLNIVIADFVSETNFLFSRSIVRANAKLL